MLVRFTIANFLSFKERTTLSLTATTVTEFQQSNVFNTSLTDISLLKSLVIYGPNSSGKSNMFKALNFMRWFMLNSSKDFQADEDIDVDSFKLSTTTTNEPSFFEIEIIVDDTKYRYGFKVDEKIVYEEWLFYVKKIKEYPMFIRQRQDIRLEDKFDLDPKLKSLARENALMLSLAAQFNNPTAISIIKRISIFKFISGVRDESHIDQTARMLEDIRYTRLIKSLLLNADLGFTDIKTEKVTVTEGMLSKSMPKEIRAYIMKEKKENFFVSTLHQVFDENNNPIDTTSFSLHQNESLGTQKFFALAGPIIDAIVRGGVLIVDEFSSRMNPVLCESIIKLFNSISNNPNNAQFIFVTHNSQFVLKSSNNFRRDQMILFKKNPYGATEVASLYDKRVRKDASFDKEFFNEMFEIPPKIDISQQLSLFTNTSSQTS